MPPRNRTLTSLILLTVLILTVSCNPNPQPEALTPIPTLAPAATLTLIPSLEGPAAPGGEVETSPAPGGEAEATPLPAGGDPANGAIVFAQNCAACHGENAEGGSVGPTLVSAEMKAKEDDYYREVINNGIAGSAMPAWSGRLSVQEIEDVIAFVRSLQ
jgi:mono/diheme cytochrome c family protein